MKRALFIGLAFLFCAPSLAQITVNLSSGLPQTPAPTFSPVAGTYGSTQTVVLSDGLGSAVIYYTLDGSVPGIGSPVYSAPIVVAASETVSAMSTASGYSQSYVSVAQYVIQQLQPAPTPTFSPDSEQVGGATNITVSDAAGSATIRYTVDGSAPTPTHGTSCAAPCTASVNPSVGTPTVLNAIATASGYLTSAVGSATYTAAAPTPAPTPTFSPGSETVTGATNITLSDSASSPTIYYTVDGSTPTVGSTVYSTAIAVNPSAVSPVTVKAIATASGYGTSAVGSATYTLATATGTPAISPVAGSYTTPLTVTLSDADHSAAIYYTTDGTAPTQPATGTTLTYTSPVVISGAGSKTVKAIANSAGYLNSAIASTVYTLILPQAATPTFSPIAGTYYVTQNITVSDSTTGHTIYYTVNGSTPTVASPVYSAPVPITQTTTVKAAAIASGYSLSQIGSSTYTISRLAIATTSLPSAAIGIPYAATLQASGGLAPYTWSILSGAPAWLVLNAGTGALSGTPVGAGSYSVVIKVTDSAP
jgi:hypothetical protein